MIKTVVIHACPGQAVLFKPYVSKCVCLSVSVCACGCSIAATTVCMYVLFGAAAASSSARGWEEERFRVCIDYICLHAGETGMTGTTPRAAKLN